LQVGTASVVEKVMQLERENKEKRSLKKVPLFTCLIKVSLSSRACRNKHQEFVEAQARKVTMKRLGFEATTNQAFFWRISVSLFTLPP